MCYSTITVLTESRRTLEYHPWHHRHVWFRISWSVGLRQPRRPKYSTSCPGNSRAGGKYLGADGKVEMEPDEVRF